MNASLFRARKAIFEIASASQKRLAANCPPLLKKKTKKHPISFSSPSFLCLVFGSSTDFSESTRIFFIFAVEQNKIETSVTSRHAGSRRQLCPPFLPVVGTSRPPQLIKPGMSSATFSHFDGHDGTILSMSKKRLELAGISKYLKLNRTGKQDVAKFIICDRGRLNRTSWDCRS